MKYKDRKGNPHFMQRYPSIPLRFAHKYGHIILTAKDTNMPLSRD